MSRPKIYNWPVPDTEGICQLQSTSGSANLIMNGPLLVSFNFPGRAVFDGITRTVSLTSANNLSARNFTINGLLNGQPISEIIAGPNANTVETTAIFDEVLSIHVNGAVSDVSIGSGTTGKTIYINYDYNKLSFSDVSIEVVVAGTINYDINIFYEDAQTSENPLAWPLVTGQTTTRSQQFGPAPVQYSNVVVNSSGDDGALIITYIQSGLQ